MPCPEDNKATKAKKHKTRVRQTPCGGFMAYSFFGYYVGYGSTIANALARYRKILCELT